MRVYLAATQDLYSGNVTASVRRMLVSYWGQANKKIPVALDGGGNPADWCVDSGAHFFISAFFKTGKRAPIEKVEAHIEKLCAYIRGLGENKPTWTVEMDLQDIYGFDLINQWREKYWYPLEKETGVRVAYVMHGSDDDTIWTGMLDNPNMNFLGVSITSKQSLVPWSRRVHLAYEAGKPVHGFAQVKAARMRVIPFWSVDSTSWGAGAMFGTVSAFNARIGKVQEGAAGRRAYRMDQKAALGKLLKTRGKVQLKDMMGSKAGGDLSRVFQNASHAYSEMGDWYNSYWKAKGIDWKKRLKETD